MLYLPAVESVIKTVLVATAHYIILHIVVVSCCFYGTVNSTELKNAKITLSICAAVGKFVCDVYGGKPVSSFFVYV